MTTAQIIVTPKRSVLDPQGEAVKKALASLGLETVMSVRVGKFIDLELNEPTTGDLRKKLSMICQDLLSNPVIEDYQLTLDQPEIIPPQSDCEGLNDPDQDPISSEELVQLEAKPKKASKKLAKLEKKAAKEDKPETGDEPKKEKKKKKKKEKVKVKNKSKEKDESTSKSKEIKDFSETRSKKRLK